MTMKKVEIFTDGACSGNPGPGGWGAVLRCERLKRNCREEKKALPTIEWN